MSDEHGRAEAPPAPGEPRAAALRREAADAPDAAAAAAVAAGGCDARPPPTWRAEAAAQARQAAPLVLFNALQFSISAISIAAVGRTGAQRMAAAALASSFINVCGSSLLIGTTLTLETTASQAFGAGELRAIGVSLQRTWLANAALCVLITALWCSAGAAFRGLRQDATLASLAGAYARACVPHAWLVGAQYPLQKVLQAQGVMLPFGAIGVALLAFHVVVTRAAVRGRGYLARRRRCAPPTRCRCCSPPACTCGGSARGRRRGAPGRA
jgi:Na+-driven multidrug efflux pump